MKLTLYSTKLQANYLSKNDLINLGTYEGALRNSCNMQTPVILIELNTGYTELVDSDNIGVVDSDNLDVVVHLRDNIYKCNYAYIDIFNRYYFVEPINFLTSHNMVALSMRCDVLNSFKESLLKLSAFINRNEFDYNNYIKDDLVTYYYDKDVIEYEPEKGSKVNKTFSSEQTSTASNIAITVINDDITVQYNYVDAPDETLPTVRTTTTADSATSRTYSTYTTMLTRLANDLVGDQSNIASFILSVIVFPFTLDDEGGFGHPLKLGRQTINNVEVYNLDKEISKYYVIADFTIEASSFLDYEPYSQYEIYLPYLGWISVSADNILNNRIIVYYVVNFVTGDSQVTVYDTTNNKIIYTGLCQLGVKVGMTATNQKEVNDNRNSNNIGLGVGLLTSAVAIVGGAVTYNPVAIAGGAISAGSTIAKFVQNNNTNYLKATGNVSSGQCGLYLPQDVRIRKTTMKPKNYDSDYSHLFGKPLNAYKRLSTIHGFTQLGEIDLSIDNITSSEANELKQLLLNGVYFNQE